MTGMTRQTGGTSMPGSTSTMSRAGFVRAAGLVIATAIALAIWTPASARASGCTDSWTNSKGGSWSEGSNWSKKAPPTSEEEACITEAGTYTVTQAQSSGTGVVTVKSLTVGGSSGTQTLIVGSTCSLNAVLTTSAGLALEAHGALTLTNGDGCGNNATLAGPITNGGTLTSEPAHGGLRTVQGNLTNTGTIAINQPTSYNGASSTLENKGSIDLAEGEQLAVS